jgi:DNA-binding MarR family transcriptional regulator
MSLRDEIKQGKPFESVEQEAMLNIERTSAVLGHGFSEALKAYDITPTQYNVLRILRGAGTNGLCRNEIRDRLIAKVPDVTRLLDRMEDAKLVVRERATDDRRQVMTRITAEGLSLLERLDLPTQEIHRRQLGHMTEAELRTLIDLLSVCRAGQ